MLTTPDTGDAVQTCPPFTPAGPQPEGFFADCNPGQNFPGTRPIAEHFNELIVNLRELLKQGHVTTLVKGDASMLWRAIRGLLSITSNVTLNVSPAGTATPANPLGGDPFNSLQSAYVFLAPYRITPLATVTINIAAGTYTATAPTALEHPNGRQIHIVGAGQTLTILKFTGSIGGLRAGSAVGLLDQLTIAGDSTQPANPTPWNAIGLSLSGAGGGVLGNVTIRDFPGYGMQIDAALCSVLPGATLTIQSNKAEGVLITDNGLLQASGATITATNNGGTTAPNVSVLSGILSADIIATNGGGSGLYAGGAGTNITTRRLQCEAPALAAGVHATSGAVLTAGTGAVAGDWYTWNTAGSQARNFLAENFALMLTGVALSPGNRGNASPAVNTVGNVQAYIQAT
jgi:hypothetical protein